MGNSKMEMVRNDPTMPMSASKHQLQETGIIYVVAVYIRYSG